MQKTEIVNIKKNSIAHLDDSFFILDDLQYIYSTANPTDFPIKLDIHISILCFSGSLHISIGASNYVIHKNDFINIGANRTFQIHDISNDFKSRSICVKDDYLSVDKIPEGFVLLNLLNEYPSHSLPDHLFSFFNVLLDHCSNVINDQENIFRKELISTMINTMFIEGCNLLLNLKNKFETTDLFRKFMNHIEVNFKENRNVDFYAKKENLTPKYFSSLVLQQTGKHAKTWIDEYTIVEIKALLNSTNMTIQQLSYELNFANPSHLSRYFKNHTKITPLEYRKRLSNK